MPTSVVLNGQKLDLSATPDLLFQVLLTLTNLEERMDSFDKRLYKLEKNKITPYFVSKKER